MNTSFLSPYETPLSRPLTNCGKLLSILKVFYLSPPPSPCYIFGACFPFIIENHSDPVLATNECIPPALTISISDVMATAIR